MSSPPPTCSSVLGQIWTSAADVLSSTSVTGNARARFAATDRARRTLMLTSSSAGLQSCCAPRRNARCFLSPASRLREAQVYRGNPGAIRPSIGILHPSCRLLAPTAAADSCRSYRFCWSTVTSHAARCTPRRPAAAACQTWNTRCRQHAAVFAKHVGAPPSRGHCNQKSIAR